MQGAGVIPGRNARRIFFLLFFLFLLLAGTVGAQVENHLSTSAREILLEGVNREMAGEWDSARILYQQYLTMKPEPFSACYAQYRWARSCAAGGFSEAAAEMLTAILTGPVQQPRLLEKAGTLLVRLAPFLPEGKFSTWADVLPREILQACRESRQQALCLSAVSLWNEAGSSDLSKVLSVLWKQDPDTLIKWRFYDDAGDPLIHRRLLKELGKQGPAWVLQSSAPPYLAAADEDNLVFFFPDRDTPLPGRKRYFSLHLEAGVQAEALAAVALDSLAARHLALVIPADAAGETYARVFRRELELRGDTLSRVVRYLPGVDDVSKQLQELRDFGLHEDFLDSLRLTLADTLRILDSPEQLSDLNVEDSTRILRTLTVVSPLPDSLGTADTLYYLLSLPKEPPFPQVVLDELFEHYRRTHPSKSCPVRYYDAVCFVLRGGDPRVYANQYAFYHFQAQLLGNEYWLDYNAYQEVGNLLKGMIATLPLQPGPAQQAFVDACYRELLHYPDLNEVLIWGLVKLMTEWRGEFADSVPGPGVVRGVSLNPGLKFRDGLNSSPRLCRFDGRSWRSLAKEAR